MAVVLQGKAAETVSGQSFNKQNLEVVRVLDIILNINHPKFEDYGGYDSIGTIYYSELSINTPYEKLWASTTQIAKPLFSHLKYYPLINEIVLLLDTNDKNIYNTSNKSSYYLPQVNIWNHPHHNALPSSIEFKNEDTNNDYQKTENGVITGRRVEDGSTDISLGEYFEEQTNIKPLLPYEGDMVIEGRFGNSIRFGSTNIGESIPDENKNQWSQTGKTGDPITIIRNGQPEETDKKGWVPLIEDSNKDASIIYMTSNQQITEFTPASLNQQSFGANIESQTSWDQELSDPLPPTTVEPNPESDQELEDNTVVKSGEFEEEPITSTPYTPATNSQTNSQEEEEDELTPFDEFIGNDEIFTQIIGDDLEIGEAERSFDPNREEGDNLYDPFNPDNPPPSDFRQPTDYPAVIHALRGTQYTITLQPPKSARDLMLDIQSQEVASRVKYLCIHNTAGWIHRTPIDVCSGFLSKINIKKKTPWMIAGYHILIDGGGGCVQAYEDTVSSQGVGSPGYNGNVSADVHNKKTININWIGGFDNNTYPVDRNHVNMMTSPQAHAIRTLIEGYLKKYPDIIILGHHQIKRKSCPSFFVDTYLRKLGVPEKNIYQPHPFKSKLINEGHVNYEQNAIDVFNITSLPRDIRENGNTNRMSKDN